MNFRMGWRTLSVFALFFSLGATGTEVFKAKYLDSPTGKKLLSAGFVAGHESELTETRYPQSLIEHSTKGSNFIVELVSSNKEEVMKALLHRNVQPKEFSVEEAFDEVITLHESGPSSNRIDLVFMGDGYTSKERQKFIDDAKRLTDDMFAGDTFKSYLPLFNVYAVFRESNESGLGVINAKDTAYRLYRRGNTLRAVMVGDASAARDSCDAAPGCDYPILMANDPYYGGLGGEFAVTTSSPTSGTMVLRHELGHNFGRVGEEYDGGWHFGANQTRSATRPAWGHWMTLKAKAQPSRALFLDWPWHNMKKGPFKASFTKRAGFPITHIGFSASGIESDSELIIKVDGDRLPFKSPGYKDRAFHDINTLELAEGKHEITFTEGSKDGDNWLSNIKIYEYGKDYVFADNQIGAFPLYTKSGSVSAYRSTHDQCLMRDMTSTEFCPICQENMWLKFFGRMKLIDKVEVSTPAAGKVGVTLAMPNLGQFRKDITSKGRVEIRWYLEGELQEDLNDTLTFVLDRAGAEGDWEVKAQFITPEVRKDTKGLLKANKDFTV